MGRRPILISMPLATLGMSLVSAQNGPWICVNQYIIHIFMQCALKIISIFSHYSSNIDPKSTENPATWRAARMHDFGISICCGQNHRQKKHPVVWWFVGTRAHITSYPKVESDIYRQIFTGSPAASESVQVPGAQPT